MAQSNRKGEVSEVRFQLLNYRVASLIDPVQIAAGFDSTPDQRQVKRAARQRLLAAIQASDSGIAFKSPSAGAAIVNAGNINGRTAWKDSTTKQTYADWHQSQLPELEQSDGQ